MNMPRRVGQNPPIAGEIFRQPEVGAAGLIRCDLKWMSYVSEMLPVFSDENAPDRTGQAWCSSCGWKPAEYFGPDKWMSRRTGTATVRRYCKDCDLKRKAEAKKEPERTWKRGSVKKGRPRRPLTPMLISEK
jgi:hypothetical protein